MRLRSPGELASHCEPPIGSRLSEQLLGAVPSGHGDRRTDHRIRQQPYADELDLPAVAGPCPSPGWGAQPHCDSSRSPAAQPPASVAPAIRVRASRTAPWRSAPSSEGVLRGRDCARPPYRRPPRAGRLGARKGKTPWKPCDACAGACPTWSTVSSPLTPRTTSQAGKRAREGTAGRLCHPARPAFRRTPALRISHFPDPHTRRYRRTAQHHSPWPRSRHIAAAPKVSTCSAAPDDRRDRDEGDHQHLGAIR